MTPEQIAELEADRDRWKARAIAAEQPPTMEAAIVASTERVSHVTDWFLIANGIDDEAESTWVYLTSEGQNLSTSMGLIEWARGIVRYEQHRYFEDNEGL